MPAPQELLRLIDRFDQHQDDYRRGRFNETQLRRDYLDPFFEILGWDVANKKGYAEAYREVIHEDAIRIDNTIKAPDYTFRIGSDRKFFVEAKKPGVNIKDDTAPAYQVRRYAWSAKLPLSLLTDFEEWAVYDTRIKPDRLDRSSVARIQYFKYSEIPERWDEFEGVFSREAILRGSFDKYAQSAKSKRGTTEVDDAFLAEIDGWREMLAQNLALRNPHLSQRDVLRDIVGCIVDASCLSDVCDRLFQGVITGGDKLFIFRVLEHRRNLVRIHSEEFDREFELEEAIVRPFLRGSHIRPFLIEPCEHVVLFPYHLVGQKTVLYTEKELKVQFPKAWSYLQTAKPKMASRGSARMKYPTWYALWCARDLNLLSATKILVPTIADRPSFAFDAEGEYFFLGSGAGGPGAYGMLVNADLVSPYYALALLNSQVMKVFIEATSSVFRGGYRAYSQQFVWPAPFRVLNPEVASERAVRDKLVRLAERAIELRRRLGGARHQTERAAVQREIADADNRINQLVYVVFELSQDEIDVIERHT